MYIRKDLEQVKGPISRLISIGKEFETLDSRWSHLKNYEDFSKVWQIEDPSKKNKIEEVYNTGRDIAGFMSLMLQTINTDFSTYPTLTAIIDKFNDTCIDKDLSNIPAEAKKAHGRYPKRLA